MAGWMDVWMNAVMYVWMDHLSAGSPGEGHRWLQSTGSPGEGHRWLQSACIPGEGHCWLQSTCSGPHSGTDVCFIYPMKTWRATSNTIHTRTGVCFI